MMEVEPATTSVASAEPESLDKPKPNSNPIPSPSSNSSPNPNPNSNLKTSTTPPATVSLSTAPDPAPSATEDSTASTAAAATTAATTDAAADATATAPAESVSVPASEKATDNALPPPPVPSSTTTGSTAATTATAAIPTTTTTAAAGSSATSPPPPAVANTANKAPEHVNGDKPTADNDPDSESVTATPRRRRKKRAHEWETESELSEPDSSLHSPLGTHPLANSPPGTVKDLDEAAANSPAATTDKPLSTPAAAMKEDEVMEDVASEEPSMSHYPKRKRTAIHDDLSESKIEIPTAVVTNKNLPKAKASPRPALGSDRGVILGYWRDSRAPDEEHKHGVIGFIDIRDRLRTRLQPQNRRGEPLSSIYPLPPGPGGTWVTFEKIVFDEHLVGLDHFMVKEYVRIRTEAGDETPEERAASEAEAVKSAIQIVKNSPHLTNTVNQPMIAHGPNLPDVTSSPRPDSKRRRISGGFSSNAVSAASQAATPAPTNGTASRDASMPPPMQPDAALAAIKDPNNLLVHTRPTRILVGHWMGSTEADPKDRHAVYGILGQNDMFRVKLVRETRDGRFVDGNFPLGAGALWVNYEEVKLEPHLENMSRAEVKEYCRIRQWQIDGGETPEARVDNETKAVFDAQARVAKPAVPSMAPTVLLAPAPETSPSEQVNGRTPAGGHDLRQSRRESKGDKHAARHALPDANEARSATRAQTSDAQERTNALARREIARVEAAQTRADRQAVNRERATAAAAAEAAVAAADAAAAAASSPALTNGQSRFHQHDDMQRLNKVWARQETLRAKAGAEDAKIYDGVKYERKGNGPFMGKLVSQGSIINIDGEDYVEYRVLTKPSFF